MLWAKPVGETEAEAVDSKSASVSSDYINLRRGHRETLLRSANPIHRTTGEIIKGTGVGESPLLGAAAPLEAKVRVAA